MPKMLIRYINTIVKYIYYIIWPIIPKKVCPSKYIHTRKHVFQITIYINIRRRYSYINYMTFCQLNIQGVVIKNS
jgi:hypothetical protein